MANNTGNPIGSTAAKDLSDNARNLDLLVLGDSTSYPDRKGVDRKSWKGMELEHAADQASRELAFYADQTDRSAEYAADKSLRDDQFAKDQSGRLVQFATLLKNSGFEVPVDYVSGLQITRPTQQVRYLNELYRPVDLVLPFLTTNFASDAAKWISNGQNSLSQNIRGSDTQLVGAGDSIMAGTTAPNTISIPQALKQYDRDLLLAPLTNTAVPGSRLDSTIGGGASVAADMVARYAANVYPLRPAATGSSRSILMIDIGANDFPVLTDANVSAWCTRYEAYCVQARADGFFVVAFTIMKRSSALDNTVARNRRRLLMNDFIRRSKVVDAFVDADQLIPDTGDTALVIDGTHPNDTGNKLLARASASEISRLGVRVPSAVMPPVSLAPVVGSAEQAVLYKSALVATANNSNTFSTKNPPAIDAGDFTLSWWCNIALANIAANNNVLSDGLSPEHAFGLIGGNDGLARIYVLPGASAIWSTPAVFPDVWNHCAVVRVGTALTYYLNGAPLNTVTYTDSVPTLRTLLRGSNGLYSRFRAYSRAFTALEISSQFNRLSEFDNDAACIFALADGCECGGRHVLDLSPSKADIQLANLAQLKIQQPGRSGQVRVTTIGNAPVFWGAPVGSRIKSWTANVTVLGAGIVNIGDANTNGRFFNAALVAGLNDLVLLSRFPVSSGQVFCNATGYTIEHLISWEIL